MMDWVTPQEAKRAGQESLGAAILCSRKHWWQIENCTIEEFRDAYKRKVGFSEIYCALCQRKLYLKQNCKDCILSNVGSRCCKEYFDFIRELERFDFFKNLFFQKCEISSSNFYLLQTHARAIRERLDREYEKLQEKKMKAKVTFSDGTEAELSKESEDNIRKALEKPKEECIAYAAIHKDCKTKRLLLKVTINIEEDIRNYTRRGRWIAIDEYGHVVNCQNEFFEFNCYDNLTPIFDQGRGKLTSIKRLSQ